MKALFCIGFYFLFTSTISYAKSLALVPSAQDAKKSLESFSHYFALTTPLQFEPIGVRYSLSLTNVFQDNSFQKDLNSQASSPDLNLSSGRVDTMLTLQKGLYWNVDLSFSLAAPTNKTLVNGYSFMLTKSFFPKKTWSIKSSFYMSSYNIDDLLNQKGLGLNLVAMKKLKKFTLSLGINYENTSGDFEERSLSFASPTKYRLNLAAGIAGLSYKFKHFDLGLGQVLSRKENWKSSLILSKTF